MKTKTAVMLNSECVNPYVLTEALYLAGGYIPVMANAFRNAFSVAGGGMRIYCTDAVEGDRVVFIDNKFNVRGNIVHSDEFSCVGFADVSLFRFTRERSVFSQMVELLDLVGLQCPVPVRSKIKALWFDDPAAAAALDPEYSILVELLADYSTALYSSAYNVKISHYKSTVDKLLKYSPVHNEYINHEGINHTFISDLEPEEASIYSMLNPNLKFAIRGLGRCVLYGYDCNCNHVDYNMVGLRGYKVTNIGNLPK